MPLDRSKRRELRDLTETVLQRSHQLEPVDKALLHQVLARGVKPWEVAATSGQPTRVIQRRVRTLILRLSDPQVHFILRNRSKWSPMLSLIAVEYWVRRRKLRQIADLHSLSLHEVRKHLQTIRGLIHEGTVVHRRMIHRRRAAAAAAAG